MKAIRVKFPILEDVCLDCCDFIRKLKIDCAKCPLKRLKQRQKNK